MLSIMLVCLYFMTCNAEQVNKDIKVIEIVEQPENIVKIDTIQIKDSIQNELINEVVCYIRKQTSNSHKFIPKYLVNAGLDNNIDICFMIAQAQIETCFGTTGAGRESSRRSMFGIIKRHYNNYEDAINHYCVVLKRYYLVNGKTEQQLMTKYVTSTGGRYAGNLNYEIELRTVYNQIRRTTNIYSLQEEYKKF